MEEEKQHEQECMWKKIRNQPNFRNNFVRGVTTRSGRGTRGDGDSGGTNTPVQTHRSGPRNKLKSKHVHFWDEVDAAGNLVRPRDSPQPIQPEGQIQGWGVRNLHLVWPWRLESLFGSQIGG